MSGKECLFTAWWIAARGPLLQEAGLDHTCVGAVERNATLDDIKNGLDFQLDCTTSTPVADRKAVSKSQAIPKPEQPAASIAEPLSNRRLRQLKVLDELLDDQLISAEEERAIRKRSFERVNQ